MRYFNLKIGGIAVREFRSHWRRNALFGIILLISIGTQFATALSQTASESAVKLYGAAIFGVPETYAMDLEKPLTPEQVSALQRTLEGMSKDYPWFTPVVSVNVSVTVATGQKSTVGGNGEMTVRAVSPTWRDLSVSLPGDDVWRTVMSPRSKGLGLILSQEVAHRLEITSPRAISVIRSAQPVEQSAEGALGASPDAPQPAAAPDAPHSATPATLQHVLIGVPVYGFTHELNKALDVDALTSLQGLTLLRPGPQPVRLYWRCLGSTCADAEGLIRLSAKVIGSQPGDRQRIDQSDSVAPFLKQQKQDGDRFALIMIILGAVAVTVVSTSFIEVRAPQFATLRTLGASRFGVAMIALVESLLTAAVVALTAVLIGGVSARLDPNRWNQIQQIHLPSLDVPTALYARTIVLTLALGLVTGLFPAIRAYRSVRTS